MKVMICGKYINLNKITKNLIYLPEILQTSYFCYSLQFTMQNRETCFLKSVLIRKDQREFLFSRKSKEIASLMKMHSTLNVS